MIRHSAIAGAIVPILLVWVAISAPTSAQTPMIAKQPAYREARQQYLLLLVGQDPVQKIWIVRDGSDVYVDRNGNGDLTEPGEKVVKPDTNQSASYVRLGSIRDARGDEHGPLECRIPTRNGGAATGQLRLTIAKKFEQEANFLPIGDTPESACIVHCAGPLTASFVGYKDSRPVPSSDPKWHTLSRKRPHLLQATIGTQVKDFPAANCVTFSLTGGDEAKRPQLKIIYDNRDPKGASIVESLTLEEETRTIFSGRVNVPAEAGGRAKLILTFCSPPNIAPREMIVDVKD